MQLPYFKYHPDPISTGAIEQSSKTCESCLQSRGFIYIGSFYNRNNINDICPWCIADGSAVEKFDGSFISKTDIEETIEPEKKSKRNLPDLIKKILGLSSSKNEKSTIPKWREELFCKTPGFSSFQEETWLSHCQEPCEFHGIATTKDFKMISEEEKMRLFENSSVCDVLLKELQEGKDDRKQDYYFKFACSKCGEIRILEDLD